MKRIVVLLGFIFVTLFLGVVRTAPAFGATVTFYFSPHCSHCLEVKSKLIPVIQEKYKGRIEFVWKDTSDMKILAEFINVCKGYHVDAFVPALLVTLSPDEKYLFVGTDNIENNIFTVLDTFFAEHPAPVLSSQGKTAHTAAAPAAETQLADTFKSFSIWTIVGAGLIDGVNPCAFAVIILFISFLSVYGYARKQMLIIGSFYVLAVFLTYLFIGVGAFNFLYSLQFFKYFIKVFYIVMILLCFLLGGFSLYDFFKVRRSQNTEDITLQLPLAIKKRIQLLFSEEYRNKKGKTFLRFAGGAFIVGILVSLLEAVCTGQVYVPVIAFILKMPELRLKAFSYLILYNLMFIFPLIIVFLLALVGVGSAKMSNFLKSRLGIIKIFLAVLFFILGIFLLVTEFL